MHIQATSMARRRAVLLVLASVFVHAIALQNKTTRHLLRRLGDEPASASQQSENMEEAKDPVDVVFTWVHTLREGEFTKLKDLCVGSKEAMKPERFRDSGGFVFSLQAALHALPWVRTFWILTSSGSCPCWTSRVLQPGSEHNAFSFEGRQNVVRCVSHGSIFEDAADLPTFNSLAIEAEIHRIPGLAEHFIYLNDDMFLGPRHVERSFFFTDDMKPRPAAGKGELLVDESCDKAQVIAAFNALVDKSRTHEGLTRTTTNGTTTNQASLVARCLRRSGRMLSHAYYAAHKSIALAAQFVWQGDFHRIKASQCRGSMSPRHAKVLESQKETFDVADTPFWVYNWIGQGTGQFAVGAAHDVPWLHDFNLGDPHTFYRNQLAARPDFFVVNDDFNSINAELYQKQMTEYRDFLTEMYKGIVVPDSAKLASRDCEGGSGVHTTGH